METERASNGVLERRETRETIEADGQELPQPQPGTGHVV